MIMINNNHMHRFKKTKSEYLYMVSKGIYLSFDVKSLEYKGLYLFYLPKNQMIVDKLCNDKINELISKDILILVEE